MKVSSRGKIKRLGPRDERLLHDRLSTHVDENAYLLGLLSDYSIKDLLQMGWGEFYVYQENRAIGGVFYLDVTGLLVVAQPNEVSLSEFANYIALDGKKVTRIISVRDPAEALHNAFSRLDPKWERVHQTFEEVGMILRREALEPIREPRLRLARLGEASEIAKGSQKAMEEELNLHTERFNFERLVRSKSDLIERERYYVMEEDGRFVFQGYLSAQLPEVGQIQGVWVPRDRRGEGIATHCMAEMCARSLSYCDHIVLRVQRRNLPAIAVYEKVGFAPFLDYLSIWYENTMG